MVTEDDHDSPDRTAVTHTACRSLVIGPVDRCKGPSRENEQANTHNKHAEYPCSAGRVKTSPPRVGHTDSTGVRHHPSLSRSPGLSPLVRRALRAARTNHPELSLLPLGRGNGVDRARGWGGPVHPAPRLRCAP
ncbi:hypothetical protein SHIRM173S_06815 [Streptomyces hirsutus]